ncbi:hypothetical protein [Pseudobutyrivibrio sp.]|uniref:hypothetical protein n=1 Tax=Pseudobutyrivibrio sp. TaxID=2014367 RepID=UPI0025D688CE|nr:hypothetical protein [Pseudobutyrivibrio sp.]
MSSIEKYYNLKIRAIDKEIKEIDRKLNNLPAGELMAYTNNGSHRWYYVNKGARKYLSRGNRSLAEKLAYKKYLLLRKNELLEEKSNINQHLLLFDKCAHAEIEKFLNNSSYFELLSKHICTEHTGWINEKFNTNPFYPEQRTVPCPSGNIVRSKSEVFIDMALTQHGIPFRYECELLLGKQVYYPDFTIKHPVTGEIIYWEHFGKMDDPEYAKAAFNKLRIYHESGLILGKNLIVTFETKSNPFTFKEAEAALAMMKL